MTARARPERPEDVRGDKADVIKRRLYARIAAAAGINPDDLFREGELIANALSERHAQLLSLRAAGLTLRQIGIELGGISRQRVRQLEEVAIGLIKQPRTKPAPRQAVRDPAQIEAAAQRRREHDRLRKRALRARAREAQTA